jgi:hypothetical protein
MHTLNNSITRWYLGIRNSAIKAHPSACRIAPDNRLYPLSKEALSKCRRGRLNGFGRFIMLIRNPYDFVWADFQVSIRS